jgi:hypothetical protein
VRVAPPSPLPQALGEQPAAERLGKDAQALLGQLLAGEGGAEVGVAPAVGLQNLVPVGGVGAVIGGPAAQAVNEGLIAVGFEAALEAANMASRKAEQSCGLGVGSLPLKDAVQDLEDIALLLTHGNPVGHRHVDRHGSSLA